MRRGWSTQGVWLREGCFVVAALAFAAATVWLGRTLPQFNDGEALQTITEAHAIGGLSHYGRGLLLQGGEQILPCGERGDPSERGDGPRRWISIG